MGGILEYQITYPNALKNDAQHNVQVLVLTEMQINGRVIWAVSNTGWRKT